MIPPLPMTLGPVMVDIAGKTLTDAERERLLHPNTGGIILFSRNYESPEQLKALTTEIHALRNPPLLIAVDHEGGRVQRFRSGFTRLPPMRELGRLWDEVGHKAALHAAEQAGWVMAAELRACGVDFTFAPVLDVDHGRCAVIGDRAFHADPAVIAALAHALQLGLKRGGMPTVGKHFPGHGHVAGDSHHELPIDERSFEQIEAVDLKPFEQMIRHGLTAVMPAHVIYTAVDSCPAGFSSLWLKNILRQRLGFDGVIFSDALDMEGASIAGTMAQRVEAALDAGCDMVLVCNKPQQADEVLRQLHRPVNPASLARYARLHGKPHPPGLSQLREQAEFAAAVHAVGSVGLASADLPFPPVGEA